MVKILDLRKKTNKTPGTLRPHTFRAEVASQPLIETTTQKAPGQQPKKEIKTEEKIINEGKLQISWEAPSFYYSPQKRYLSLVIAALLTGGTALIIFRYDNLTSIFLILASLVLLLYSKQRPIMSKIVVDQSGVSVDDIVYHYKDLKSFWIEYNPRGPKELSLESTKWYMPYVKVLLNEQNPVEVRSLIINFLPEKEHENSLVDHIGRKLGL